MNVNQNINVLLKIYTIIHLRTLFCYISSISIISYYNVIHTIIYIMYYVHTMYLPAHVLNLFYPHQSLLDILLLLLFVFIQNIQIFIIFTAVYIRFELE
jgi:hypothetical protein